MTSSTITTVAELQHYLYLAMQLEHSTIPPYLMALYSIHPGTNSDASHVIRVVAVEEMLHLTLAANVLNAVGGTPDLTRPDFVPRYPTYLPDGEQDFQVDLQPFSKAAVDTFLQIERRDDAPAPEPRLVRRRRPSRSALGARPGETDLHYYSIGDFYQAIAEGLEYLNAKERNLFSGDPQRQVTPEYYYSGGGGVVPVQQKKKKKQKKK